MAGTRTYLATTALQEWWSAEDPLLLVHEGCVTDAMPRLERQGYHILEPPHSYPEGHIKANEYLFGLKNRLIQQLRPVLNRISGFEFSERGWNIIIGHWLLVYLSVLYDRYTLLKSAFKKVENLYTWGFSEGADLVPLGSADFVPLYITDEFNLILCERICRHLGFPVIAKGPGPVKVLLHRASAPAKLSHKAAACLSKALSRKAEVLVRTSYIGMKEQMKEVLRSRGRICPLFIDRQSGAPSMETDPLKRSALRAVDYGASEFEQMVQAFLWRDIPMSYIEGFIGNLDRIEKLSAGIQPKTIYADIEFYSNDNMKLFMALNGDRGTRICCGQHGGTYGQYRIMPYEQYEMEICDSYLTWGWEASLEPDLGKKVIPHYSIRSLNGSGTGKQAGQGRRIMVVSTAVPRWRIRFESVGGSFGEYLEATSGFIKGIAAPLRGELLVRPFFEDYGWGYSQKLQVRFPELSIQDPNEVSLYDSLSETRLVVLDHMDTVFLEMLSKNIPTICFINPKFNCLRESARLDVELLIQAGVVHDSPAGAAQMVNAIYGDPGWWHEPQRQKAVRDFVWKYSKPAFRTQDWYEIF